MIILFPPAPPAASWVVTHREAEMVRRPKTPIDRLRRPRGRRLRSPSPRHVHRRRRRGVAALVAHRALKLQAPHARHLPAAARALRPARRIAALLGRPPARPRLGRLAQRPAPVPQAGRAERRGARAGRSNRVAFVQKRRFIRESRRRRTAPRRRRRCAACGGRPDPRRPWRRRREGAGHLGAALADRLQERIRLARHALVGERPRPAARRGLRRAAEALEAGGPRDRRPGRRRPRGGPS